MMRNKLLQFLAVEILKIQKDSPVLIGINGIDASGKTILAQELTEYLKHSDRHIIKATIDGFHNPEKIRYSKGQNSPIGYYQDSFNHQALTNNLLDPLSTGNLEYKIASFDYRSNSGITQATEKATNNSILIMEGIFLFRPELISYRDLKIFIDIDFENSIQRAIERQAEKDHLGSKQRIIDKYNKRYIPGQKLYIQESKPKENADIIIDNRNFENPKIIKN